MKTNRRSFRLTRLLRISWVGLCLLLAACHLDMYDQQKGETYEGSTFFPDGAVNRPLPPGTVAQRTPRPEAGIDTQQVLTDQAIRTGRADGAYVATSPIQVTDEVRARGRERYNIYCAPCHAVNGGAQAVVSAQFNPRPASFYLQRLRDAPDGYLFDVITNGRGQMQALYFQLSPEDRWAVIAHVRNLQQNPPAGVEVNPTEAPALTPTPAP